MGNNPLQELGGLGQSIWLDYIRRDLLTEGSLAAMVGDDGVTGVTSNPAIFKQAIGESSLYDAALEASLEGAFGLNDDDLDYVQTQWSPARPVERNQYYPPVYPSRGGLGTGSFRRYPGNMHRQRGGGGATLSAR